MKIAIFGYGNLGRGVAAALPRCPDMEGIGIFTRRRPEEIHTDAGLPVFPAEEIGRFRSEADAVILCGGSATDLPEQTPRLAREFNVLDSFDTHARIGAHFAAVDSAAREGGHLALLSAGWDPGLFSLARLFGEAVLPDGDGATFWGRGVSQGHSQAIRRIEGVEDAREYTVPIPEVMDAVKHGRIKGFSDTQCHRRECYVVAKEGADRALIERNIREMPYYFAGYETSVQFIDRAAMEREHAGLPHGGTVIRRGRTGKTAVPTAAGAADDSAEAKEPDEEAVMTFSLALDSNPAFTAGVLLAYTRALVRKYRRGERGGITVFDVAPGDLLPCSAEEARRRFL